MKKLGFSVYDFDPNNATEQDIVDLKKSIYRDKVIVLKNQKIDAESFLRFGRRIGKVREYYEKMYHHPNHKEIFVSSNVSADGEVIGVPHTGKFWHSDYAFMTEPFAFTMLYPQVISGENRGTYYIDMGTVYSDLNEEYKSILQDTSAEHTVRRYFKIRPNDVYRPISEVINEINEKTPPVIHPTVVIHPVTGEKILYISAGFTSRIVGLDEALDADKILHELLSKSGQIDSSFQNDHIALLKPEQGDIVLWDNRRFVHRAVHADIAHPSINYRLTIYDEFPFSADKLESNKSSQSTEFSIAL